MNERGENLIFRPLQLGDEVRTFPCVDAHITQYWIGWEPPASLAEERKRIKRKLDTVILLPPCFEWAAFDSEGFVGCCGIDPSEDVGEFEVNVWVANEHRGKGYGKQMVCWVTAWAAQHTELAYLVYSCTDGNLASAALVRNFSAHFFRRVNYEKRGRLTHVMDYKIDLRALRVRSIS